MHRQLTHELMDDPGVPRADLEVALRYIRGVNRRLGGVDALMRHLRRWSVNWPKDRPITLLDIATGSADLPLAALAWAERAGFDLRVTGIDKHLTTLDIARRLSSGRITLIEADALAIDDRFDPGSFDYVHTGLFLHHLSDEHIVTVLRSMNRIARAGIIWNDLMRSRMGHAVISILTFGRPKIVRHDARVSVLAGFTRNEAERFAAKAGITFTAYRQNVLAHRFTLAGEKPGAWLPQSALAEHPCAV